MTVNHLGLSDEDNPLELYERMASKRWEMIDQPIYDKIPVEDVTDEQDAKFPILIEEVYYPKDYKELAEEEKVEDDWEHDHLFILVHGLGGSAADMKQIMNEIALINSNSLFYLSWANEGKRTMGDINDLGKKLANEVKEHLQTFHDDSN